MKKVYSVNTQLYKVTGVEKVMMDVHHAIKEDFDSKIVGTIPYEQVRAEHMINRNEYIRINNPFIFRNSIVIIHERKLLILFWILNILLLHSIRIVYVHHNLFHDRRLLSVMPKTVVAIADRGIENLESFFKVPSQNIHKIYNCVKDTIPVSHPINDGDEITLLYPARINSQKQQLQVVENLRGKLDKRIKILFAGEGPHYQMLQQMVKGDSNFQTLGFRDDVKELLSQCDYILLFSTHEGLPITLIEATMTGTPIICSDVGGNPEICRHGENGWVLNDWESLLNTINSLPNITNEEYERMSLNSRSIYEENFTFEVFRDHYIKLLNSL